MGKVIGPINIDDWFLMRQIKESVRYMKETDAEKYAGAIRKEQELFDYTLAETARAA